MNEIINNFLLARDKFISEKHVCNKDYTWNPATCSCENGKYLGSVIDNSVLTCDKIIEETKTI